MSERGSFVTEYIYCGKCFSVAKEVLLLDGDLSSVVIRGDKEKELPIIAGKVSGMNSGEELYKFENRINISLAEEICHELRIAVFGEKGEKIFVVKPNGYLASRKIVGKVILDCIVNDIANKAQ